MPAERFAVFVFEAPERAEAMMREEDVIWMSWI